MIDRGLRWCNCLPPRYSDTVVTVKINGNYKNRCQSTTRLQTADPMIATNYRTSITVTVCEERGALLKAMGTHSAGSTGQVKFILMDEDSVGCLLAIFRAAFLHKHDRSEAMGFPECPCGSKCVLMCTCRVTGFKTKFFFSIHWACVRVDLHSSSGSVALPTSSSSKYKYCL